MHQRIVLKLSGEFFSSATAPLDITKYEVVATQIERFVAQGIKVAVVVGAGNILRGRMVDAQKYPSVIPDHAGMLGAAINGMLMQMVLEKQSVPARVESSFQIDPIIERHKPLESKRRFEQGEVIILGGTGLPFFSTDTAAVLFGLELGVDAVVKATHTDGVYDKDPHKNPDAKRYEKVSYDEVLEKKLQVMDGPAFALAREHALPLVVCKWSEDTVTDFLDGKQVGTLVS